MFRPTGYEHSSLGTHTWCICDQCTNNNCDNCRNYKNIGYSTDKIEDSEELYDSDGIDAVVEKYGVDVSTYTLYFKNQKLKSFNNKINISDIDFNTGIDSDNSIIVSFYYNKNQIGRINTGVLYSNFSEFTDFHNDFKSKFFKDLKLEKSTKKELVVI
jgi:hypothetical protein